MNEVSERKRKYVQIFNIYPQTHHHSRSENDQDVVYRDENKRVAVFEPDVNKMHVRDRARQKDRDYDPCHKMRQFIGW
jgi:hypothetical protein